MKTMREDIALSLEKVVQETYSDFAGLGLIDKSARKLRWHSTFGSISKRTPLVEQKPTVGLSGMAIRSGRPARSVLIMTDAERFKLGETVMLGEQLRAAATVPLEWDGGIQGVLLLGRRTDTLYSQEQLDAAWQAAKVIAASESTA